MNTTKSRIDPKKWYSLTELVENQAFPWLSQNIRRYRRFVQMEKSSGGNKLKMMETGTGRTKRYSFKGSNVIALIELAEAGKIKL